MNKLSVIASLLLAVSTQAVAQTWEEVKVGATTRKTLTYVPKNVEESPALVISLHGFNQDPNYQMKQTAWNDLADSEHFIVTYPQGNGNAWDISGNGDIQFIEQIMSDMELKHNVDKNRIYVSGFSMGGMMTYHCMAKLADKVAAFGPVSGIPVDYRNPSSTRKVPIMHIHGTADDVVKWGGDPTHPAGGYGRIDEYVKKWAAFDGCDVDNPKVVRPYPANNTAANATRTIYTNVNDNVEVNLIAIDGKGHWHSNEPNGVHSTKELWAFFKRYKLNQSTAPDPNFQVYLCFGQSNMEGFAFLSRRSGSGVGNADRADDSLSVSRLVSGDGDSARRIVVDQGFQHDCCRLLQFCNRSLPQRKVDEKVFSALFAAACSGVCRRRRRCGGAQTDAAQCG